MARVKKDIVDYFPHDADATAGDTLTALQGQFGNDGYAFWFKLLEKLASSEGHFIDCRVTKRWQVILGRSRVDEDIGLGIMALLCEMHAVDPELWNDYKIIWCQKFVDNLDDVYRNRRRDLPQRPNPTGEVPISTEPTCIVCGKSLEGKRADAEFCSDKCRLQAFRETDKKDSRFNLASTKLNSATNGEITTVEKGVSTRDNAITTVVIPQSKVKYSKVDKTKVDNSTVSVSSQKNEKKVLDAYKHNIGELTERTKVLISQAVTEYSADWVYQAIAEAVMQNNLTWVYIAGILKNWQESGDPTMGYRLTEVP